MDFISRPARRNCISLPLNARGVIRGGKKTPDYVSHKGDPEERSDSMVKVLNPVFLLARLVGIPLQTRFRWLSFRTLWLSLFLSFCISLTLLTAKEQLKSLGVGTVGAVLFYSLSTTYLLFFLWFSRHWPAFKDTWIKVEELMIGLPKVKPITLVTLITSSYTIIGLSEHALSIFDNIRRVNRFCITNGSIENVLFEMYYKVQYREIFSLIDFAMWKGVLTSVMILMLTVIWTFTDVFLMCISLALAARVEQLLLALQETKGKDMSPEYWRKFREIYLEIFFLTKRLDNKISFVLFASLGLNTYNICLMLLNALSTKTNRDFLQIAYYIVSFSFLVMRLAGTCICAARVNDNCKELLPLLFAVSSNSYNIEVHRIIIQISCDPLSLTAFNFFAMNRSTALKIAGTIVTYEIVLVQCNLLNTDETDRRPMIDCPN